jgi:hypothetical protein
VEKNVPSSWLDFDLNMFVFRLGAQNFANRNNIGLLDINVLLLWAKFRFQRYRFALREPGFSF